MNFSHYDHDEAYFTLHDCIATRASLENGKLSFEFDDGFGILPDHPENPSGKVVQTDFSKVEYAIADEEDVTVYVFEKTLFGKTVRTELSLRELVDRINERKCKLEFLFRYTNGINQIVECELISDKKPYRRECTLKITTPEVGFFWNTLCKDKVR